MSPRQQQNSRHEEQNETAGDRNFVSNILALRIDKIFEEKEDCEGEVRWRGELGVLKVFGQVDCSGVCRCQ